MRGVLVTSPRIFCLPIVAYFAVGSLSGSALARAATPPVKYSGTITYTGSLTTAAIPSGVCIGSGTQTMNEG